MADYFLLEEIGARISSRRRALGLTQEQVAERMDVSIQMISNLELGKRAIRPEPLVKVCTVLDISAYTTSYNKVVFWIAPEGQLRYNASSG